MNYNLFLDDHRNPEDAYLADERMSLVDAHPSEEWEVVRTYEEFGNMIMFRGMPAAISFDHDLHFEHMRAYFNAMETGSDIIEYENFKHKTGWHAAKDLVDIVHKYDLKMPRCFVHSANEIGRKNIKKILDI